MKMYVVNSYADGSGVDKGVWCNGVFYSIEEARKCFAETMEQYEPDEEYEEYSDYEEEEYKQDSMTICSITNYIDDYHAEIVLTEFDIEIPLSLKTEEKGGE